MIITDQKINDTAPYSLSVLIGTGSGSLGLKAVPMVIGLVPMSPNTTPSARHRNCNVKLDDLDWCRPDLDCELQQARGIPRNLRLDETHGLLGGRRGDHRRASAINSRPAPTLVRRPGIADTGACRIRTRCAHRSAYAETAEGDDVDLPQTLHGQLYLLAFDRDQHRFDGDTLGFSAAHCGPRC